jgi:tetratricopeptide (TPR) repeat protein
VSDSTKDAAVTPPPENVDGLLRQGFAALQEGRGREAAQFCRRAIAAGPSNPQAHFLVGLVALDMDDRKTAMRAFGSVTKLDPKNAAAFAQLSRLFMRLGQPARAEKALKEAKDAAPDEAAVCDLIGVVTSMLGDQVEAKRWYLKAVEAAPGNEEYAVNLATACMFLGENDAAVDAVGPLLKKPAPPAQAEWLYSSIVRQRSVERPVALLERARRSDPHAAAFLAYAAGKEFEDCGDWTRAFEAFDAGARAKRSTIDYDEAAEGERFAAIADIFNEEFAARAKSGCDAPAPIFVVGQPRTGTTLIERIITSHSQVESAGELQQFRLSAARMTPGAGDRTIRDTFSAYAQLDMKALGEEYLRVSAPMRSGKPRFVDKLPGNYFYVPLILAALPNARIVHLTRGAMDACFASFKQLFAEAYAHSYDQQEMARHFVRYAQLMEQWRRLYPGRFLDVSYEATVSDLEPNARRIVDFLGLSWEDACLRFYEQDASVATASAVQVRERPHTRSVGRWRRYEAELAPMREELRTGGIAPDSPP